MTAYTPILSLPEVAPNQDQKETTINTALAILEAAMNDSITIDLSAGNVTLNTDQFTKYFHHEFSGHTVSRTVTVPTTKRWFSVENLGTAAIVFTTGVSGGSTVSLGAGKIGMVVADGTNLRFVIPDPSAGTGVLTDLSDVSGSPTDGQLLRYVTADANWEPWTLSIAFSGLSDFPGAYSSNNSKLLAVKSDGSGLEWVTSAANIHTFTDLSDTPANYSGAAGRTVKVNSGGTGLIFAQPKLTDASDFVSSYTGLGGKLLRVNAGASAVETFTPTVSILSDGPGAPAAGTALKYVRVKSDGSGLEYADGTGGPDHFYQLADVPSSYTGQAGKLVLVNGTADGLIYGTLALTKLSDTPANYTGAAGKFLQVNTGATGVQFAAPKVADLSDGPGATTSNPLKLVRVNSGATALEYHTLTLTDVGGFPSSLTGQGGKFLQVKVDESGLQFSASSVSIPFTALTDAPSSYTGAANKHVAVNSLGTALVFVAAPFVPTKLGQLSDVEDGTGTPAQGSFLRWVDGVWQADSASLGTGTFLGLSDTPNAYTGAALQVVRINAATTGLEFAPLPLIPTRLGQLADVEDGTGTPTQGAFLRWIDGVWQAEPPETPVTALADLTDVDMSTPPTDGQVLTYSHDTGEWKPADATGGGGGGTTTAYFGSGPPSTTHGEGSLYFDIDQSPYAAYVEHLSTWEPFGPPGTSFDVGLYVEAAPTASERVLRVPITRASTFPANFSGSYASASTAATGSTVFDVRKNGTSIGSITFAASGTTGTFTTTSGTSVSFSPGDYLEIIAPNTPDATLKEIGFSLKGVRN